MASNAALQKHMREALAEYDLCSKPYEKAEAAVALADSVRDVISYMLTKRIRNVDDDDVGHELTTVNVGLTIFNEKFPVEIDGIIYSSAMNAFQAMKAPKAKRALYAKLHWSEAIQMGRSETIDIAAWDSNRVTLMESILVAQAVQHEEFKSIVLDHATGSLKETSLRDQFWTNVLPFIWKNVHSAIVKQGPTPSQSPMVDATRVSTSCSSPSSSSSHSAKKAKKDAFETDV